MAKAENHYLEYLEQGFLDAEVRARCSCGATGTAPSGEEAAAWHADHAKAEEGRVGTA